MSSNPQHTYKSPGTTLSATRLWVPVTTVLGMEAGGSQSLMFSLRCTKTASSERNCLKAEREVERNRQLSSSSSLCTHALGCRHLHIRMPALCTHSTTTKKNRLKIKCREHNLFTVSQACPWQHKDSLDEGNAGPDCCASDTKITCRLYTGATDISFIITKSNQLLEIYTAYIKILAGHKWP